MNANGKSFDDPASSGISDDEDVMVEYEPQPDPGSQRGILAVRNKYEADIMAIPGVKGIGVTQNATGDDAIVVYVLDESVAARVPKSLGDFEVETVVVGEIDAQ